MGLYVQNPNPNGFVRFGRKLYNDKLQFKKGYNFVLWFIFAGALFGFALARLQYLDIDGKYKAGAAPGEYFYMQRSFQKAGMLLHLASVLPASLLVPWQFIPAIRYRALLFHRINGYLLILLLLSGNVGGLMIARYAFGGDLATQSFAGFLTVSTVTSVSLAFYNIKRLQIDQHRAWMIRTWVYMGVIVTIRIITILSALIISRFPGYFLAMPCRKLESMEVDTSVFPACQANPDGYTAIEANFNIPEIQNIGAALNISFGMAGWIGIVIHFVGAEIYLRLTPAEDERLRRISYERQLERGFSHPGSAGLTADRLGDAHPWAPPADLVSEKQSPSLAQTLNETIASSTEDVQKPATAPGWR